MGRLRIQVLPRLQHLEFVLIAHFSSGSNLPIVSFLSVARGALSRTDRAGANGSASAGRLLCGSRISLRLKMTRIGAAPRSFSCAYLALPDFFLPAFRRCGRTFRRVQSLRKADAAKQVGKAGVAAQYVKH